MISQDVVFRFVNLYHNTSRLKIPPTFCHDFHRFSSFSTLSPRRSHSFCSTMTYFFPLSYLILSYLSFIYLIFSGHMIKMTNMVLFGKAVYNSGLSHKSRRGPVGVWTPSVEMSLDVRNSQFLPTASTASNSSLVSGPTSSLITW